MVQVNGINVEREKHSQVAEMILAGGRHLDLLVVDDASDRFFDERHIELSKDQPFVDVIVCPNEMATNASGLFAAHRLRPSLLVTDRVIREVKAICSVRLSVRLFPFCLLNLLTFELKFVCVCVCVCHGYSSPGIESQGHRSKSKVKVKLSVR